MLSQTLGASVAFNSVSPSAEPELLFQVGRALKECLSKHGLIGPAVSATLALPKAVIEYTPEEVDSVQRSLEVCHFLSSSQAHYAERSALWYT